MVSKDSEPDGCSRRHWVSPGYIHLKQEKKKKKKKNSTRGFSLVSEFHLRVDLLLIASIFLQLMVSKEAI